MNVCKVKQRCQQRDSQPAAALRCANRAAPPRWQAAKADEAAWAAMAAPARADKERFLEGQERAARGFMAQARTTLKLLGLMAENPGIAPGFLQEARVPPTPPFPATPHLPFLFLDRPNRPKAWVRPKCCRNNTARPPLSPNSSADV